MYWYIAIFFVSLAVAVARMPKPQSQSALGLDDINVPLAEIGREIPVLFGTREIMSPNVVWYGDLITVAVKKKGGKK